MNVYRLTHAETKEVIEGSTQELDVRFGTDRLREHYYKKNLLDGVWKVDKIGTLAHSRTRKEKMLELEKEKNAKENKKKIMTLDEVCEAAKAVGMRYGEYVATYQV